MRFIEIHVGATCCLAQRKRSLYISVDRLLKAVPEQNAY